MVVSSSAGKTREQQRRRSTRRRRRSNLSLLFLASSSLALLLDAWFVDCYSSSSFSSAAVAFSRQYAFAPVTASFARRRRTWSSRPGQQGLQQQQRRRQQQQQHHALSLGMVLTEAVATALADGSGALPAGLQDGIATLLDAGGSSLDAVDTASKTSCGAVADGTAVTDGSLLLTSLANIWQSQEHPFRYAFMFPAMTAIACLCQLAGIGGAALASPMFLLVFPLLGPEYPLPSAASAISTALLTECFGFASGLSGFWRAGLVDWSAARRFWVFALPAALLGALLEPTLASATTALRAVYAALMISLSAYLFVSEKPTDLPEECPVPPDENDDNGGDGSNDDIAFDTKTTADGTQYRYLTIRPRSTWKTVGATAAGASLTGVLGVGIGEVILPQLVRVFCVPLPVAAGTSVAVVVATAMTAAVVQFAALAVQLAADDPAVGLDEALLRVVPWSLVQYTVPGAILGGQIAPRIAANRWLDDEAIERVVATLFAAIGVAFALKIYLG